VVSEIPGHSLLLWSAADVGLCDQEYYHYLGMGFYIYIIMRLYIVHVTVRGAHMYMSSTSSLSFFIVPTVAFTPPHSSALL
jgi:hypothetical protein